VSSTAQHIYISSTACIEVFVWIQQIKEVFVSFFSLFNFRERKKRERERFVFLWSWLLIEGKIVDNGEGVEKWSGSKGSRRR
jgi:hypothetical protein